MYCLLTCSSYSGALLVSESSIDSFCSNVKSILPFLFTYSFVSDALQLSLSLSAIMWIRRLPGTRSTKESSKLKTMNVVAFKIKITKFFKFLMIF